MSDPESDAAALRRRMAWRDAMLASANLAILSTDSVGRIVTCNACGGRLLGREPDEIVGRAFVELFCDAEEIRQRAAALSRDLGREVAPGFDVLTAQMQRRQFDEQEWTCIREDGLRIPVRLSVSALRASGADAGPGGFLLIGKDVTKELKAREDLRRSQEELESAFRYALIGKALVAPDGRWIKVNPALCRILGYSEQELRRLTFQDITHEEDLDADLTLVQEMLAGKRDTYQLEKRYIHKDGHVVFGLLSVSLVHATDGAPLYFVSQVQDISDRKEMERRLKALSLTDELTGLPNRRALAVAVEREYQRARRHTTSLSVVMLDVDDFKMFNDSFGHLAGDDAIRTVAACVARTARGSDVPARFGGEEFVVLLPCTDRTGARSFAERLLEAVRSAPWPLRRCTVSIGIATLSGEEKHGRQLIEVADAALYYTKRNGKDHCTHADEVAT